MPTSLGNTVFLFLVVIHASEAFKPNLNSQVPGHDYVTISALREVGFCAESYEEYTTQIRKANAKVDLSASFFSDVAHCDNEKLVECSIRVIKNFHQIIILVSELNDLYSDVSALVRKHSSLPTSEKIKSLELYKAYKKQSLQLYENLAETLGSSFHTIQDFYSHSNYVDKEMAGIAQELVIFHNVIQDHDPNAKYCPLSPSVVDPSVHGFTSGYFSLKNYVRMMFPNGKCIHGDDNDGINKDEPSKDGYKIALKRAKSATVEHLKDILFELSSSTRQSIFKGCREFPLIKDSETMGVAIDFSASMGDDIAGVKRWIRDFVLSGKVSFGKYIMVLFNDPGVNEPITFYNTEDFLSAINAITPISINNYDCPELMYTGIEKLAMATDVGSSIYVFSDADAKDLSEKRDKVRALILQKEIRINFVLTGNCGVYARRRRRRSVDHTEAVIRKTTTRKDAEDLSHISGGVVVDSPSKEVDTSIEIARGLQNDAAKMNLIKVSTIPRDCAITPFQVLKSGSNVTIVLKHNLNVLMPTVIYAPSNSTIEPALYLRTMRTTLIVLKNVEEYGDWRMQTCFPSIYEIYSTEKVHLFGDILELVSGVYEDVLVAIEKGPLIGKLYNFTVQLEAPGMVGRWNESDFVLSLVDSNGVVIPGIHIFDYKFRSGPVAGVETFTGILKVPSVPFNWLLTGKTTDGLMIQRQTKEFTPEMVRITSDSPFVKMRDTNEVSVLSFLIENTAITTYSFRLMVSIPRGGEFFHSVSLTGGSTSTTVVVPAKSSMNVNVTVRLNESVKPPACSVKYTDTEICEVALSASSSSPPLTIGSAVEIMTPCTATASVPKGCLFTEEVGSCGKENSRNFKINILQEPELGGFPCPTQLSGQRPCRFVKSDFRNLAASFSSPTVVQLGILLGTLLSLLLG